MFEVPPPLKFLRLKAALIDQKRRIVLDALVDIDQRVDMGRPDINANCPM